MLYSSVAVVLGLGAVAALQLPLLTSNPPYSVSDNILDDSFEEWLEGLRSEWGFKGLSIAVVRKNDDGSWKTETKGYGVKNSRGDPVDENTLFAIGSNSKLFTTLALGTLVESDKSNLTWTSKVTDILKDDWKLQDPVAEKYANLLDILSHRTGLPRHDKAWLRGHTAAEAVRRLKHLRPSAEFREIHQYNNFMYMAAARIVEAETDIPYAEYLEQEIISKLPFTYTTINSTKAQASGHLAEGFARVARNSSEAGIGWSKSAYEPTKFFIDSEKENVIAGAGGVVMSAHDAAVWLKTLLSEGRNPDDDKVVIPAAAVRQAAYGVTIDIPTAGWPDISVEVYGGGQSQFAYQGHNIVEHNGGWKGWLSVISRAPQDGLGISVFTNWDQGSWVMEIIKYRLYEKALGLPHVDWSSRYRARFQATLDRTADPINAPHDPSPPIIPIASFRGTYEHPAYGNYTLCPEPSSAVSSPSCAQADSHWNALILTNTTIGTPVFGAASSAPDANYFQLVHVTKNIFRTFAYEVTTDPTGDKVVVVPDWEDASTMEFVVGDDGSIDGLAWTGIWGQGSGVGPAAGSTVKERAEVWFDRVHR